MRCSRTRGKKGEPHLDPDDPPRRRANKVRGRGTWENDRPPVLGIVGRESGDIRLSVCRSASRQELEPKVLEGTREGSTINTDDCSAYLHLEEAGRVDASVSHAVGKREWARDDDGDGIREVHNNTMEGIWTGLRNFLRIFRGISKKYLSQYVAIFAWAHNVKVATVDFLRKLLGMKSARSAST